MTPPLHHAEEVSRIIMIARQKFLRKYAGKLL